MNEAQDLDNILFVIQQVFGIADAERLMGRNTSDFLASAAAANKLQSLQTLNRALAPVVKAWKVKNTLSRRPQQPDPDLATHATRARNAVSSVHTVLAAHRMLQGPLPSA